MAYLFLSNRGRANVYDKQELVPGNIKIVFGAVNDANTLLELDVFFTGITVNRSASRTLRKAINRHFHVFQFGEAESDIILQGITIAGSQQTVGGADNRTYGEAKRLIEELDAKYKRSYNVQLQEKEALPEDAEKFPNWLGDFVQGIRNFRESIVENKFISGIHDKINKSIENINEYIIHPINQVIPETVKLIKSLLGVSEPEQQLDTDPINVKIGTIQEINAFFHAFNSGNYSNRVVCYVCGIPVEGILDGLSYKSLPNGGGYSFTLKMTGLHFHDAVYTSAYTNPTIYHPENDDLRELVQGGLELGFSAIRSGNNNFTRIF